MAQVLLLQIMRTLHRIYGSIRIELLAEYIMKTLFPPHDSHLQREKLHEPEMGRGREEWNGE